MSIVAIVGRPNVGKSTLFNKLVGKRKALVSDFPGVTRDRHYGQSEWCGVEFSVVDTGGLSFSDSDAVEAKVHKQSLTAFEEASVVICLFDVRDGITNLDREIVDIFRKKGKSVVYAVNKVDTTSSESSAIEFNELGIEVIPISTEHKRNIDVLLDRVIELLPEKDAPKKCHPKGMKIALVGRPNVGKSTIINYISNEERVVVHELPGTTRDTIDVEVSYKGKNYVFIDTAGVKRRAKTREKLDKFSTLKSLKAIEDADIVFVVLDASEGFTRQDISLAAHSFDSYKTTAILLNKCDKITAQEKEVVSNVRGGLKELCDLPILCISAKTGHSCDKIFGIANELDVMKRRRIPTSELNRFFGRLVESHPAPDKGGKQVKLNYITQVDINPPVFVVFTNQPEGVLKSYKKYLVKGLRKLICESLIPIVIKFRAK